MCPRDMTGVHWAGDGYFWFKHSRVFRSVYLWYILI